MADYPGYPARMAAWRRYLPRTRKGWLISIACFLVASLVLSYMLARTTPPWYEPLSAEDQRVLDDAGRAQRKLTAEWNNTLQAVPLGDQRWAITQNEINAMIAANLASREGAPPDGPQEKFSAPVVVFSPGKVTMSVRTPRAPGSHPAGGVVSIVLSVRSAKMPDGTPAAVVKIDGAWVGCLPIPKSLVEKRAREYMPKVIELIEKSLSYRIGLKNAAGAMPEVRQVMTLVLAGEPFPLQFTYNRRRVMVKDVLVDKGLLSIVFSPPTPAAVRPR